MTDVMQDYLDHMEAENTRNTVIAMLERAEFVDNKPFMPIGQGIKWTSQHGSFRITLLRSGKYGVRQMNVGKYDNGTRCGHFEKNELPFIFHLHTITSYEGLSGLA